MPWTRNYLENNLAGTTAESGPFSVILEKVTSVTGDSIVNQRKGKFTCVYDLEINGKWVLTDKSSGTDEKLNGTFTIPEFAYDTNISKLEVNYKIQNNNLSPEQDKFMKEEFTKAIGVKLSNFVDEIISGNYKDVFVQDENNDTSGVKSSLTSNSSDDSPIPIYTNITQNISFSAFPQDIYECLIDEDRIKAWSRAPVKITPVAGGSFSLFNGKITGNFEQLIPNQKIVQSWRLSSWENNKFSKVTITINGNNSGTKVTMVQESVPHQQKDDVSSNWTRFYWCPIRDTFGFGLTMD